MISSRFFACLFLLCFASAQESAKPKYTVLKSLILPGWGNYELGDKNTAYVHVATEIALWAGYVYHGNLAKQEISDYKASAKAQLLLPNTSHSAEYYRLISRYNSYDDYIEFQRRQGAAVSSDLSADLRWRWKDEEARKAFNRQRIAAHETEKDVRYWLYGAALNRVLSFFTTRRAGLALRSSASYSAVSGNALRVSAAFSF